MSASDRQNVVPTAERTAMTRWSPLKLVVILVASAALWAFFATLSLFVGSIGQIGWPSEQAIASYRIDVVLLASHVGAALACAGVVYQAVLQNPLADPYLLGVSSGAMLFTYLWQLPGFTVALVFGEQA